MPVDNTLFLTWWQNYCHGLVEMHKMAFSMPLYFHCKIVCSGGRTWYLLLKYFPRVEIPRNYIALIIFSCTYTIVIKFGSSPKWVLKLHRPLHCRMAGASRKQCYHSLMECVPKLRCGHHFLRNRPVHFPSASFRTFIFSKKYSVKNVNVDSTSHVSGCTFASHRKSDSPKTSARALVRRNLH